MNCYQFESLISDYIDGLVDSRTRATMDAHARECDGCKTQLLTIRDMLESLHSLPAITTSDGFEARLMRKATRARAHTSRPFVRRIQSMTRPLSAAAAVILLLTASYITYEAVATPDVTPRMATSRLTPSQSSPQATTYPSNPRFISHQSTTDDTSNDQNQRAATPKIQLVNQKR